VAAAADAADKAGGAAVAGAAPDDAPAGWRRQWSNTHRAHYYVSLTTGDSVWTRPE
jgi:hypothetical protein